MKKKVNKEIMRQNNVLLVFETVYRSGEITKAQLSDQTEMSFMAVGRIVDFLLEQGLLMDQPGSVGGDIGRPAKRLCVNHNIVSVGLSLDTNGVFIGMIDPYGKLLYFDKHLFEEENIKPDKALKCTADLIVRFLQEHHMEHVPTVGMVIPGLIDVSGKCLAFSSQLGWKDIQVTEILEGYAGVPKIILDNDVKARAQAENRFGAGKGYARSVLLNIGSGVGAGIIIDNEIYRGKENLAGEIGHTALSFNNRMCACGRNGCIGATISLPAVLREARTVDPLIDICGLEALYHKKVQWAKTLLNMTAEHIIAVIDLLANAYAPDVVVLCGSLMDKCSVLREMIVRSHRSSPPMMFNNHFSLKFSATGPDGNAIGAATTAFNYNIRQTINKSSQIGWLTENNALF